MSLRDLKLPEAIVEFPGGSFAVRGLSLNDIAFLVSRHGEKIKTTFAGLVQQAQGTDDFDLNSVSTLAVPVLRAIPELAAEMIACASGEPDAVELATRLPAPVQVDALEKLLTITFESGGGAKKVFETVVRLAQGTTGLVRLLNSPQA